MCRTCPETTDCAHDRETDTWPAPNGPAWRNPRFQPPTAAVSAPLAHVQPESDHGPALTVDGFTAALRALGRDGSERRG